MELEMKTGKVLVSHFNEGLKGVEKESQEMQKKHLEWQFLMNDAFDWSGWEDRIEKYVGGDESWYGDR